MSAPEILALIPARGGSKGVPRKNVAPVAGKPLIAHTIAQALSARRITRVVVSTDDPEIAEVARAQGAEVPFIRPAELARDESSDLEVFTHALSWLRENEGYACELVVHLRATSPVRRVERIDEAVELMRAHPEATALRSVSPAVQTPYKMWRVDGGLLRPLLGVEGEPESHSLPRQRLPQVYWQNGYVDVIRPETILRGRSMCGGRVLPFIVREPVLDIDYPESIPEVENALNGLAAGRWPPEGGILERHAS